MKCPNGQIQRQKVDQQLLGAGWGCSITANGQKVSLWGDGNVTRLSVVTVVQFCEYAQNH